MWLRVGSAGDRRRWCDSRLREEWSPKGTKLRQLKLVLTHFWNHVISAPAADCVLEKKRALSHDESVAEIDRVAERNEVRVDAGQRRRWWRR